MKALSERMNNLGTENAFVVLQEVNRLTAQGQRIINFCIGQPDFRTPEHICEAGKAAIDAGKHGYTASSGIPELRASVADFFHRTRGIRYDPDDIVVGCGAKPFIWYSIFAVTNPNQGDEVIYPKPGYPIYQSMIQALQAVPVPITLQENKNFHFDIDQLRHRITPRTKLLILNSPHNPTGRTLTQDELVEISAMCQEHDIWVYSDEVYSQLVFDHPFASIASMPGMRDRTILVDGASKTYAMTGWRIGFMANSILAPHIARLVTNSDSCAPYPNQAAAVEALDGPQDEVYQMSHTFRDRRDYIVNALNRIEGIECQTPGGAFYVWPNVTQACNMTGCANSEAFRKRLLYDAGVAVLSDIHFGGYPSDDGQHIRISYASGIEQLQEGIDRIHRFINGHQK